VTGAARRLLSILAVLFLGLTYLLARGVAPDPTRHERILQALHQLVLSDAALQRDVLEARAGLLPHYDPLVQAVAGLRSAVAALGAVEDDAFAANPEIRAGLRALAAEIEAQERRVNLFKSDNALLHNSLAYFTRASHELGRSAGEDGRAVGAEIGALANAMFRFLRDPQGEAAEDAASTLERLQKLPATPALGAEIRILAAHGRIILGTLPEVDRLLGQVLATRMSQWTHELQEVYLDQHARREARAGLFRILLYIASVLLLAYLGRVFWRLRANERSLRARLSFERLVTTISAQFVDLPTERLDAGIERALEHLGEHMAVDRAYLLLLGEGGHLETVRAWCRAGLAPSAAAAWDLLPTYDGLECHGYAHVPRVRTLPPGPERAALAARQAVSWLCLPIGYGGKRDGLLAFDAVRHEKHWSGDDRALLRTVGDLFASAMERKRAETEREALEARLRQSQRMEAIGTLAGGIAHDFNNILGVILGYGEMALATLPEEARSRQHVQQMLTAGQRAKGVVDQILTFSRRSEHERRPVRLQPLIEETVSLLRASLPATIAISLQLEAADAVVASDATQLQQVVVNLCTNAAQAMTGGGTLELALVAIDAAGEIALSHGALPPGRYARLAVRDTGHGMDAATVERIFEPFFTTKAAGEGTGLGLATVHGIVAEHGGALNVRSHPGEGSTFEAYLPLAQAAATFDEPTGPAVPCGHGETILLVEDERPLLLLEEEMLAALGYEPIGHDSGSAALAAFRADPQRFDLVLADQVMPGMTGTQLARALHEIRPELPIILVSGYAGPVRPEQLRAAGIRELLRKPLLSRDLASCLARHLRPGEGARDTLG
jgi:signal transduction histidine kinase/ActR/RegA family two-component response regulator